MAPSTLSPATDGTVVGTPATSEASGATKSSFGSSPITLRMAVPQIGAAKPEPEAEEM